MSMPYATMDTDLKFLIQFPGMHVHVFLRHFKLTHDSLQDLIYDCWEADPRFRPPFSSILKRLNLVIIDCTLEDRIANMFWKTYFQQHHEVKWDQFVNKFGEFLNITKKSDVPLFDLLKVNHPLISTKDLGLLFDCLKAILTDDSGQEETVSIERFGRVINWFGPMSDDERHHILYKVSSSK